MAAAQQRTRLLRVRLLVALALGMLLFWAVRAPLSGSEDPGSRETLGAEPHGESEPGQIEPALEEDGAPLDGRAPLAVGEESGAAFWECTSRGRLVTVEGDSIPDVQITAADLTATAKQTHSDDGGNFQLSLELPPDKDSHVTLRASKDGFTDLTIRFQAKATTHDSPVINLGTIVLHRLACLQGRVVAQSGEPLPHARVAITSYSEEWSRKETPPIVPYNRVEKNLPVEALKVTECDEQGRFVLADVPSVLVYLWARPSHGAWWTSTPPLTPVERGEPDEYVLRCSSGVDDAIEVVTLDPVGEPLPLATLVVLCSAGSSYSRRVLATDKDGRCTVPLENPLPHSFLAMDPRGRFGPGLLEDVDPRTRALTISLTEAAAVTLRVEDAEGLPVPRYTYSLEEGRFGTIARASVEERSDGTTKFVPPSMPFDLVVEAEPFQPAVRSFASGVVPDPTIVVLRQQDGCRGRVMLGDSPVSGATVTLHQAAGQGEAFIANGLPARSSFARLRSSSTDEDGFYRLYPRNQATVYVRAEKEGLAVGEIGPLSVDVNGGLLPDIQMTLGGDIRGRLILDPGMPAHGRFVAASRGDAFPIKTESDTNGEFRFSRLTPGRWLIAMAPPDLVQGTSTLSTILIEASDAFNCAVEPGKETYVQLDLRGMNRLQGRVAIDGNPPRRWRAALVPKSGASTAWVTERVDGNGSFLLPFPSPGTYRLTLQGELTDGSWLSASRDLSLTGPEDAWEADLASGGPLRGVTEDAVPDSLVYVWEGQDMEGVLLLSQAPDNSFFVEQAPASSGTIRLRTPSGEVRQAPIELQRGEELLLQASQWR